MLRSATLAFLVTVGCGTAPQRPEPPARPAGPGPNQVVVLGMIHGNHRTSDRYGLDVVRDLVRRIRPDYVLTEIPPDRLPIAQAQFRSSGRITEPRVRAFPEYTEVIIPLARKMGFGIVGCAAWTKELAAARRAKIARWKTERPREYAEVMDARARMNRRLEQAGLRDDPRGIHTERYDRIVAEGMEPYARLWNDDLGAGGWDRINAAHYALIAAALDAHRGEGKRFLVTFGAWHKHRILRALRKRDDIVLLPARAFLD